MTLKRPLWMQAASGDTALEYAAVDDRALLRRLLYGDGILRPDVVGAGLKVTQRAEGPNFSVDIQAGAAAIIGDDVSDQGFYLVESTATENRAIPAPPASGTRVHRVVAQVRDKLHNGAYSTYDWDIVVLEDTGAGTPAVPPSAIPLARVSVSAGQVSVQDSHITDDRFSAALIGSSHPFVASDALRPPNPYDNETIWRTDKQCWELAVGGAWFEVPRRGGGGSAWSTYTPTWTAATTNPNIGNGTRLGRYMQVGKTVHFVAEITMGSTTTYGSGIWSVGLPPVAARTSPGQIALVRASDTSVGVAYDGQAVLGASSTTPTVSAGNAWLNSVQQGTPFTWANGDILRVFGTYEAA